MITQFINYTFCHFCQELEDCRADRRRLEVEVTSLRQAATDEQQTLVKMKDIELCSVKARRERLEQDLQVGASGQFRFSPFFSHFTKKYRNSN